MRRFATTFVLCALYLSASSASANIDDYISSIRHDPSKLHDFFKQMPKSGELHYHLDGGASTKTILSLVHGHRYCLNPETLSIYRKTPSCDATTLDQLTPSSKLYRELTNAWSFKRFKPGQESAHDHFFKSFSKFHPIVADHGPQLLASIVKRAADQHELYLEVMALPDDARSSQFGQLIHRTPGFSSKLKRLLQQPAFQNTIDKTISASRNLISNARQQLGCNATPQPAACHVTVKLQYVILREQSLNPFFAQALNGFAAANESPDLVGINLVQAEDGPIARRDYVKQMQIIRFLHHAYPKVHITLHAGELVSGKQGNIVVAPKELKFHIRDALYVGSAERIGHGTDIHHEANYEALLTYMANNDIPVEINLTSNQSIFAIPYTKNPIHFYLKHHVPVVLSTDDEGILKTSLTDEYVALESYQSLPYEEIKTINRNGLTYSFLPGKSLWKKGHSGVFVDECRDPQSTDCQTFIHQSQKALLQWRLEIALQAFEKAILSSQTK